MNDTLLPIVKIAFIVGLILIPILGKAYRDAGGRPRGFGGEINDGVDGIYLSAAMLVLWGIVAFVVDGIGLASEVYLIALTLGNWIVFSSAFELLNSIGKASAQKREERRQQDQDEEARQRDRADAAAAYLAADQANREHALMRRTADRIKAIGEVAGLVSYAQEAAAQLPVTLAKAELALDQAEQELVDNVPSSFWEAMEIAAQHLSGFDTTMQDIDTARRRHALLAPPLKPDAVDFTLGVSLLPDAAHTGHRMSNLYRQAQKKTNGTFALIYEQRRNTTTLIQGFKSMGEAFNQMGSRLTIALASLGDQLDFRLGDIESALRQSAESMGDQQRALLHAAELSRQEAAHANSEIADIALQAAKRSEQDASNRRKFEAEAKLMLDNLQRRRKP